MMAIGRELIFRFMVMMLVSTLVELLLPEGSMRPLVRLVLGISVVGICLESVMKLL